MASEEIPRVTDRFTNFAVFVEELDSVPEPARKIFEEYSGIAPDKVKDHIVEIRNRSFKIYPYPCIGRFRFLNSAINRSLVYDEVLTRVKAGEKLLDLGCCFGQEVRRLVVDGAPAENVYAADLRSAFVQLGYDLFLDKDKLKATFITADVFDPSSDLKQLDGQLGIVHTESFFHLFNWEQQVQIAKRIVKLFNGKPENILLGIQIGQKVAGDAPPIDGRDPKLFWHNAESWGNLWKQVGEETETEWKVEATMEHVSLTGTALPGDIGTLTFTVRKV